MLEQLYPYSRDKNFDPCSIPYTHKKIIKNGLRTLILEVKTIKLLKKDTGECVHGLEVE